MKGLGALAPGAALSAGGDIISTALGMALSGWQDRRQLKQQQKLTQMQTDAQKGMIDYQNDATYDMWQKTGPVGQVGQLKEAGLNPALMYGMGGGTGGQSVTQSAGVSAGSTSQQPMAMVLGDLAGKAAQVNLMKSQAANLDADTDKKRGVDTVKGWTEIQKLIAETKNEDAKRALNETLNDIQKIDKSIKENTFNDVINRIYWEGKSAGQTYNKLVRENRIGDATEKDVIATVHAELGLIGVKAALLDKQGQLTQQEIDQKLPMWERALKEAMISYYTAARQQGWDISGAAADNATTNKERLAFDKMVQDVSKSTELSVDVVTSVLRAAMGKQK